MPGHTSLTLSAIVVATASFTVWNLYRKRSSPIVHPSKRERQAERRKNLPDSLGLWRYSGNSADYDEEWTQTWETLRETLSDRGYTLWDEEQPGEFSTKPGCDFTLGKLPELRMGSSFGFQYVHPDRTSKEFRFPGNMVELCYLQYANGLQRVACTSYGLDVYIRVIVVRDEGKGHLDILRKIATGADSYWCNNHTLPMIEEIQFEDIVLGVFPKIGGPLDYHFWAENSVGDMLEIIMQMLEALEFIRSLNIAHRDAFKDNFLVQFHPESMKRMRISPTRPRVYLMDFETSVQFPKDYEERQCFVSGLPLGGSCTDAAKYSRPKAPECLTGELYSPFKLDVWQLGTSLLKEFKTGISLIDDVLEGMANPVSSSRLGAGETLEKLSKVVYAMPPDSLLFKPTKA